MPYLNTLITQAWSSAMSQPTSWEAPPGALVSTWLTQRRYVPQLQEARKQILIFTFYFCNKKQVLPNWGIPPNRCRHVLGGKGRGKSWEEPPKTNKSGTQIYFSGPCQEQLCHRTGGRGLGLRNRISIELDTA